MKIGDRIEGFKFNGNDYPDIGYINEMDEFVGKEGIIEYIDAYEIEIRFNSNEYWSYPKELAKDFLIK